MARPGLFIGDTGGKLRVSGKQLSITTPDAAGNSVLRQQGTGAEIVLDEEAVDELEEIVAALRTQMPRFERTMAPLAMKKFVLDNALFPKWPVREMEAVYRREGALVPHQELLAWRTVLQSPDRDRLLYAKLVLSVTRREIKEFRKVALDWIADALRRTDRERLDATREEELREAIEQFLLDAYPYCEADGARILERGREAAHANSLGSDQAISTRPAPVVRDRLNGAFVRGMRILKGEKPAAGIKKTFPRSASEKPAPPSTRSKPR